MGRQPPPTAGGAGGAGGPGGSGGARWPAPRPKPLPAPPTNLGCRPGDIFTVAGVLTPGEAAALVAQAERVGFPPPPAGPPGPGMAARDNARLAWHDPALAAAVWATLAPALAASGAPDAAAAVACSPALRLYRYAPGQRFGRHYDDAVSLPGLGTTRHTVLVYLTGCGGGETVFYGAKGKPVASVAPAPGLALLHRHGDDCLLHEGALVVSGVKYVLRTDVVYSGG